MSGSSPAAGLRRATNPRISPSALVIGKVTRSRNWSIRRPVEAVRATPAAIISVSLTPSWRRCSTRLVHPAGA